MKQKQNYEERAGIPSEEKKILTKNYSNQVLIAKTKQFNITLSIMHNMFVCTPSKEYV